MGDAPQRYDSLENYLQALSVFGSVTISVPEPHVFALEVVSGTLRAKATNDSVLGAAMNAYGMLIEQLGEISRANESLRSKADACFRVRHAQ